MFAKRSAWPEGNLIARDHRLVQRLFKRLNCADGAHAVATEKYCVNFFGHICLGPLVERSRLEVTAVASERSASVEHDVEALVLELLRAAPIQFLREPRGMNQGNSSRTECTQS